MAAFVKEENRRKEKTKVMTRLQKLKLLEKKRQKICKKLNDKLSTNQTKEKKPVPRPLEAESRANLQLLDDLPFAKILKYLPMKAKKNLRLSNRRMRRRVENIDNQILIFTARSSGTLQKFVRLPHAKGIHLKMEKMRLKRVNITKAFKISAHLLTSLDMSDTKVENLQFPESIPEFPRLKRLDLSRCLKLYDGLLCKLLKAAGLNLEYLDLSFTQISAGGLVGSGVKFKKLKELRLNYCGQVKDSMFSDLLDIAGKELQHLSLSGTRITGENLTEGLLLNLLCGVKTLNLSSCAQLTDEGAFQLLRCCRHLQYLDMQGTKFGGSRLGPGIWLGRLKVLNISNSFITEKSLCDLLMHTGMFLKSLDVSGTTGDRLTGEHLTSCKLNTSSLEVLKVNECSNLAGAGLEALFRVFGPTLRTLELNATSLMSPLPLGDVDRMIPKMERLEVLSLQNVIITHGNLMLMLTAAMGANFRTIDLSKSTVHGTVGMEDTIRLLSKIDCKHLNGCQILGLVMNE